MIFPKFSATACVAIFCGACLFPSGRLLAQAPPGPCLPRTRCLRLRRDRRLRQKNNAQLDPRKTLAGFWKLNAEESDDPQKKLEEARQTQGGTGGGPGGGGPGGGGGRVGIGVSLSRQWWRRERALRREAAEAWAGTAGETTEQMRELVRPDLLAKHRVEGCRSGFDRRTRATNSCCYTDGRKIQKSKDDSLKQVSRPLGRQPSSSPMKKGRRGRKMSRTFELSVDGRQIYETWHIENGRSGSLDRHSLRLRRGRRNTQR